MGIRIFIILLSFCGSFSYEAASDEFGALLETLDDIKEQEDTEDPGYSVATNTGTLENDEVLRELADISDMLERTTADDKGLTTANNKVREGTDWEHGTMLQTHAKMKDLFADAKDSQQDQRQITYKTVGCYKDNQIDPRPLPELLADLTSEVDWYQLDKVVKKCAELAHGKGYTHFGIQSFGQCRSGKDAAKTYSRDGESAGCQSGLGGRGENLVFVILSPQSITTPPPTAEPTTMAPESTTALPTVKPTTIPSECQNYKTLDSATRSAQFNASVSSCDDKLPRGWYRFSGAAGNTIPTSCVPTHHCGTHAPGWLSGPHPAAHEGKVRREVCFHWKSCCSWRNSVLVRNCGEFFVYDLSPTLTCNLRYCGKGPEPVTTSPHVSTVPTAEPETSTSAATTPTKMSFPVPTTNPTSTLTPKSTLGSTPTSPAIPPECLNYKLLKESNRAQGYSSKYRRAICDKSLTRGWYRFTGEAGDKMPNFCVSKLRCGTHAPGWLNASHPSVADGIVNVTVCFHWGSNCCYWSTKIRVRNCGGYFVYELHRVPYCSLRYCGNKWQVPTLTTPHSVTTSAPTTPITPTECTKYRVLSEGDRSQHYQFQSVQGAKPTCDRWMPKAWYRFSGLAGDRMPDKCVPTRRCGTLAPGWLKEPHPGVHDGVVPRTVCFNWGGKCCRWSRRISVRNCGDFYVYKLQKAPVCKLRYCGVGQLSASNRTTTPKLTTSLKTTTTPPYPTTPNYGFVILCLPAGIHVHVSRQSLPPFVKPSLLRLDDPRCGVKQMDDNGVMLATPLNSCGTVRRTDDDRVSFHNKVVAEFDVGSKRSLVEFPFKCTYKKLSSLGQLNKFQPLFKRGQVMDSTFDYEQ